MTGAATPGPVTVRPERPGDADGIRAVVRAAFPTAEESVLVDALRADPGAWIDGLSWVAVRDDENDDDDEASRSGTGTIVGHALLTRCHVGRTPALCLAPCSVPPGLQGTGVGTAVTAAALDAARAASEHLVVVLGHPTYYPRFGFERASPHGIRLSVEVPDEALMVLRLDPASPVPSGLVRYAPAFGI
ncbi:N-acetyltransferase [Dietzia sp. CH92]|uniref:GNAT family N-acetyltransferase n=1 Tax=Dietzia sp. CH92 TaxID=3051823 RepID=UPI0028D27975|nr:N-acetyltransferase [Dietzia sp. CH92]